MEKLRVLFLTCLLAAAVGLGSCSEQYDDSALWREVEDIRSKLDQLNSDIGALQLLVGATEGGKQVVQVIETGDGYRLVLSDGSDVDLYHGKRGSDGTDGENGAAGAAAPVIGVREYEGRYFWTLTTAEGTRWLTDPFGDRIPVSGENGQKPVIAVDPDNYWTVNGERLPDGSGGFVTASGAAGDNFFHGIAQTDEEVIITLADGTTVVIEKFFGIVFEFDAASIFLGYGQTAEVGIIRSGVLYTTVSKPDGWRVELHEDHMVVAAPSPTNVYAERSGRVTVLAVGKTNSVVATLEVVGDPLFRAVTTESRSGANKVYEFSPVPGQFVNGNCLGYTMAEACAYAQKNLDCVNDHVSLSALADYTVAWPGHSISNDSDYNIQIIGDSFEASSQPGIGWVMLAGNDSGLPDGTRYELPGGKFRKSESIQDYQVAYYRPVSPRTEVRRTDYPGSEESVAYLGSFHRQGYYYPSWVLEDSYTLTGPRLQGRSGQGPSAGIWTHAAYDGGYADNFSPVDRLTYDRIHHA